MKAMLALYDMPELARNLPARQAIESLIVREISELDSVSNLLQAELADLGPKPPRGNFDSDALNVMLKLSSLARGDEYVRSKVADVLDGIRLRRSERRAMDAYLQQLKIEQVNSEAEADALVARFRAMTR